jgi:hypothetical protein
LRKMTESALTKIAIPLTKVILYRLYAHLPDKGYCDIKIQLVFLEKFLIHQ